MRFANVYTLRLRLYYILRTIFACPINIYRAARAALDKTLGLKIIIPSTRGNVRRRSKSQDEFTKKKNWCYKSRSITVVEKMKILSLKDWLCVRRLLCRHWEKFNANTQTIVTTTTHFTIINNAMLLRCFIGYMRWRVSRSFNEITNYFHNDFHPIFHWKLPPEWLMRDEENIQCSRWGQAIRLQ